MKMKNKSIKLFVRGCQILLITFLFCVSLSYYLFWPSEIMVQKLLTVFSGREGTAVFICPATEIAAFELCFDDEKYEPHGAGMIQLYQGGDLLKQMTISDYTIANGFSGSRMVGKKRYRIELKDANDKNVMLDDIMKKNKEYRVVLQFSEPISRASLYFTCLDFESTWMKLAKKGGQ